MMPGSGREAGFPLDTSRYTVPVRDPLWQNVWLSESLRDLSQTPPFLRLYRIKQLGPTELVYPGATHSRASHSIGVYALAFRILRSVLPRGADGWVTPAGCHSFLAAALLHDLGHFPYTHSLKELPLEEHEALTARLVSTEPLRSLVAKTGADPDMTAAIVHPDSAPNGSAATGSETAFFRKILSGVLDPDKLDYLNRDAYYCGVPYGLQDTEFVLSRIIPDRERGLTLDSDSILSVESVLFSKYLMYRSVYWHRQVRIATAMMKKSIYFALERGLAEPETLYGLDDDGLYRLLGNLDHPSAKVGTGIRERKFYSILAEFPFAPNNPGMRSLESLSARTEAETALAEALSRDTGKRIDGASVLIDIPERISFESDLYIPDEKRTFSESSTVFNRNVVDNFTVSLRKVRIAVEPGVAVGIPRSRDLGEKLADWAGLRYTD